ncbi:MAG TPA: hypothetical protein VE935_23965 [Burkholderiales bacterium]|jgi:hypothetical protein|nr:hypothetical protein [Burkholderiales bacterium]
MRLFTILLCLLLVAACGEREQVAEGKRTYQGKRDTKAWDNEPLPYALNHGGKWNKGDQSSWEQEIKARQLTQNEYERIGR